MAARIVETIDDATGIAKRVVIDWRGSPRTADLKPAVTVVDDEGQILTTPRGGEGAFAASRRGDHRRRSGHEDQGR